MNIYFPRCAVCSRTVDKFHIENDPRTGDSTFIAECHGQRQEVVVTAHEIATMKIRTSLAFVEEAAGRAGQQDSLPVKPT